MIYANVRVEGRLSASVSRPRRRPHGVRVELKGDVRGQRKSRELWGPGIGVGGGTLERSVDPNTFK